MPLAECRSHLFGLQVLVEAGDPSPWFDFFKLSLWRQFKLTVRDAELVQGRIIQVGSGL